MDVRQFLVMLGDFEDELSSQTTKECRKQYIVSHFYRCDNTNHFQIPKFNEGLFIIMNKEKFVYIVFSTSRSVKPLSILMLNINQRTILNKPRSVNNLLVAFCIHIMNVLIVVIHLMNNI